MSAFPQSYGMNATPVNNEYSWDNIDSLYPPGSSNLPHDVTLPQTNQPTGHTSHNVDDTESGEALIINLLEAMAGSVTELREMVGRTSKDVGSAELSETIGNKIGNEISDKLHKWEHHLGKHLAADNERIKQTEKMIRTLYFRQESRLLQKVEEKIEKLLSDMEERTTRIMNAYLPRKEFLQLLYGAEIPDPETRASE